MSLIQALIIGLVSGAASVFPVSSSGHVVLLGSLMGIDSDMSLGFLALLHIGTLIAVVCFLYKDIVRLFYALAGIVADSVHDLVQFLKNPGHPEDGHYNPVLKSNYRRFAVMLIISTAACVFVCLLLRNAAEAGVSNLLVTGMGFFVTALVLGVSSLSGTGRRKPSNTRVRDALLTGILEGLSVIPGVSRLGMAEAGACFSGFRRRYMVKYILLLGIPCIVGGIVLECGGSGASTLAGIGAGACVTGVFGAAASAYILIRISSRIISVHSNRGFSVYCGILGVLCCIRYML